MIGKILGDLKQLDISVYTKVIRLMKEYDAVKLNL